MISYAPIIDTRIPGFTSHLTATNKPESIYVTIKFTDHPMASQLMPIYVQVRSFDDLDQIYGPFKVPTTGLRKGQASIDFSQFMDAIPQDFFRKGNFYQMRIAYGGGDQTIQNEEEKEPELVTIIGPYSSWGVGRYCEKYSITPYSMNPARPEYSVSITGGLRDEPIAFYQCSIWEGSTLIEQTDWLNENIKITTSVDGDHQYSITYIPTENSIMPNTQYEVQWGIKTVNDFQEANLRADIQYTEIIETDSEENSYIVAQTGAAQENGYIACHFPEGTVERLGYLKRSLDDGTDKWITIGEVSPQTQVYKDFSIEQGKRYQYALDVTDSVGIASSGIRYLIGEPIIADFDAIFLADEDCQLRIAFNPDISTFKDTILESKQDTIGGKYPYFFRNGDVKYKEIALSGLISYHLDSNHYFIPAQAKSINMRTSTEATNSDITNEKHFNLTSDNFYKEREFKLEVLNWLNNGRPKYLRTPGEGNYVVRLTNVSLRPEKTLGGMLHSFSATAYEIANHWSDVCDKPICQGVIEREQSGTQ